MNYQNIFINNAENENKPILDESSGIVRNFFLTFIILEIYVLSVVAATTDYQILVPYGKVHLFIFNFEISLLKFYIFSPLLLMIVHLNLLMNICEHQSKLQSWSSKFEVDSKKKSLLPFFLNYYYYTSLRDKYHKYVLSGILYITVFLLPLFVIVFIQWKFSKYHSTQITGWHFFLIFIQLLVTYHYARKILLKDKFAVFIYIAAGVLLLFSFINLCILVLINQESLYTKTDSILFKVCEKVVIADYRSLPEPANTFMKSLIPSMRLVVKNQDLFNKRTTEELLQFYMGEGKKNDEWLEPYEGLSLKNRNLQFADFTGSKLFKAEFTDTRLHEATFYQTELYQVVFDHSQIRNTNFEKAKLQQASFNHAILFGTSFNNSKLRNASFKSSDIQNGNFMSAKLQQSNFDHARLNKTFFNKADMTDSNLSYAEFYDTNFTGTEFSHSILTEAKFYTNCNLAKANMVKANLSNALLRNVNCSNANFQFAELSNASFVNLTAVGANFFGANLIKTKLKNIEIKDANFTAANLINSQWTDVEWNKAVLEGTLFSHSFSLDNIAKLIDQRNNLACQNKNIARVIAQQYSTMFINDMFTRVVKQYNCEYLLEKLRKYIKENCNKNILSLEKIQCKP